ncbi:D-aminoacyl-tRNA deacylase [Bacteroidota bacterium]
MRVVIQRVDRAEVTIDNAIRRKIKKGIVIFIGIEDRDNSDDIDWLCNKVSKLRIFNDEKGIMNWSVNEISGEVMVISQFTLHASTKKGNRPSYIKSSKPETAIPMYEKFLESLKKVIDKKVVSGEFGAHMEVELVNNGPVTILVDSKNRE